MIAKVKISHYCDIQPGAEGEVTDVLSDGYGVRLHHLWRGFGGADERRECILFFKTHEVEISHKDAAPGVQFLLQHLQPHPIIPARPSIEPLNHDT